MGRLKSQGKSFEISKWEVWEAFRQVKANQGAAGVDGQSVADFEADLKNNLFKMPADRMPAMRDQYRELAVEWDEARDNPQEANRLFDALHALYKKLRDSAAGQQAIASLLDDPITAVRLAAATHSLAWQPTEAERVLQEIEQEGSLHAVTAKWTLRSYRRGKLNLDW